MNGSDMIPEVRWRTPPQHEPPKLEAPAFAVPGLRFAPRNHGTLSGAQSRSPFASCFLRECELSRSLTIRAWRSDKPSTVCVCAAIGNHSPSGFEEIFSLL